MNESANDRELRLRMRARRRQQAVHSLFNPPDLAPTEDMASWRIRVNEIIFEHDTPAGKLFDIVILIMILASILVVMLESVAGIRTHYGDPLRFLEWGLTILFTIEYVLRLACVKKPSAYAKSFFGVVDLASVAPTYMSLFVEGTQALLVVRVLRMLRIFRLFKLSQFVGEAESLSKALVSSVEKITVFLGTVLMLTLIIGTAMFLIEGESSGFDNIPRSVYWAIVTLTTVGYGDIAPRTAAGQALAAAVMILGYAIIAVPTGIVSAELVGVKREEDDQLLRAEGAKSSEEDASTESDAHRVCESCELDAHDYDAVFCKRCGDRLPRRKPATS